MLDDLIYKKENVKNVPLEAVCIRLDILLQL